MIDIHLVHLQKQLKSWNSRKEELISWVETHEYEYPSFLNKLNELRAVECKVCQIESRLKRPDRNTKAAMNGIAAMALPIISMHYSF